MGWVKKTEAQIQVGACALVWALWKCGIYIFLTMEELYFFLQVTCMSTHGNHE
jgi:hypothetical protein